MITEVNFERFLLINNRILDYKGIFHTDELFAAINRAIEDIGYVKREKKSEETVTEEGIKSYVELRPWKELSKYLTLTIKLRITLDNVTEIIEEIRGEKKIYHQGSVHVGFDAWILTDYQHRWGIRPFFWFVKEMVNKYLMKNPIEANAAGQIAGDVAYLYAKIKRRLNSYREPVGKPRSDEEVAKEIEAELKKEIAANKTGLKL